MKFEENKSYWKLSAAIAAALIVSISFFFLLFHLPDIGSLVGVIFGILEPFLIGAIIAYLLTPLTNNLEGLLGRTVFRKRPDLAFGAAIVLAMVIAILLFWVLLNMVIPEVWQSARSLALAMPGYLERGGALLTGLMENQPELRAYYEEYAPLVVDWVTNWFDTEILGNLQTTLTNLGGHVSGILGGLKNFIFGVLVSVYVLANRKRLAAQANLILHSLVNDTWAERIRDEVKIIDGMFNGFLVGKLIDSAIVGVICFFGCTIMGFKSPVLIAVVIGVTNIVPVFGPIIGAVPCALLLLIDNPFHCLLFVVFVIILQQVDGNFIGPKILGDSTGLSSFWVLFSILLFGGLWGVPGMLVGVPLFGVIYDMVRRLCYQGLRRNQHPELIEDYNSAFHPEEQKTAPGEEEQKETPNA